MSRRWPKITLRGPEESRAVVQAFLLGQGSLGVWEDATSSTLYFPPDFSEAEVRQALEHALDAAGHEARGLSWQLDWEPEQDWMSGWRNYFRPLAVGDRIIVKPPWGEIPSEWRSRDVVIEIEPKMAFGTGTHPTTQLVLEAEEQLVRRGMRVLDVGTGSGILSIAAAQLGAQRAFAFDVDVTAVRNAAENLRRNHVQRRVCLFAGTLETVKPGRRFDLLLANIQSSVHKTLLGSYRDHTEPGGFVVLSGILRDEVTELVRLLEQTKLTVERVRGREEWVAIEARNQSG